MQALLGKTIVRYHGCLSMFTSEEMKENRPTHRGACSDRQGNELSCPLNSCEKSGIFTMLSSCAYRCGCKDPPKILENPRLALERRLDKRQ